MKVTYESKRDTLTAILKSDAQMAESDEDKSGVILDYGEMGNLISPKILDTSKHVSDARIIQCQTKR